MTALLKALGITTDLDKEDEAALALAVEIGFDFSFLKA